MTKKKPKPKKVAPPAPKRGAGKPPFEPTKEDRERVKLLAGYRIPQDEIVLLVKNPRTGEPISPVTLRKVFEEELRAGYADLKQRIIAASVTSALGGNVTAQIWLQKALFGMKETTDILVPPPSAGEADGQSMLEAARRVAFTLAHGAQIARKT